MTPEQLLSHHATSPATTPALLSRLPAPTLSALLTAIATTPHLLPVLFTHPPLRATLLSTAPPEALTPFLHTILTRRTPNPPLQTLTTTATTLLRHHRAPLLLPLLRSLAPARRPLATRILRALLACATPSTPLLSGLLDLPLPPATRPHLLTFALRVVTTAPPSAYPALLAALLTTRHPLARALLALLSRAGSDSTAVHAVLAALHDGHAPRLAATLANALLTRSAALTTGLARVLFLLLAHADHPASQRARHTFDRVLAGAVTPAVPGVGASNTSVLSVLSHAVRVMPPGCAAELCDLLEGYVFTVRRALAASLLEELFVSHPPTRARVLKAVLAGLSVRGSPVVHACLKDLLTRLLGSPTGATAARSCTEVLIDALDGVFNLPEGTDARFVQLSVAVLVRHPRGRERVMLFLRKTSNAKDRRLRLVGCRGMVAILAEDVPHLHGEVCQALSTQLASDPSGLLAMLVDALECNHIHPERVKPLVRAITQRIDILNGKELDIATCFTPSGQAFVQREPLALIIRFCITAQPGTPGLHLMRFAGYLCDMRGALTHACDEQRSPVPRVAQVALVCELLETVVGLGLMSGPRDGLSVYGIAIILRDLSSALNTGVDERSSGKGRVEQEYLTMRQAATASQVGASGDDGKDAGLLSTLRLRIRALSAVAKIDVGKRNVLVDVVRAEIVAHVETDIRAVLGRKEVSLDVREVDALLDVIRTFFEISSPWASEESEKRARDESGNQAKGDSNVGTGSGSVDDGDVGALVSCLDLDKDVQKAFEEVNLRKVREEARIRMRQSSLGVLCVLLARKLVRGDVAYVMGLTDAEPAVNAVIGQDDQRNQPQSPRKTSTVDREEDLIMVVSRLTGLFRREFANSLSISLTLSYLDLIGHFVCKKCRRSENTRKVRKTVFDSLTSLLREYSIRHQSVMRSILKLLTTALDAKTGVDFAKSVLTWLGGHPCLLNSKFVESDDRQNARLGVNDFDRDIIEEAIALDAGEESEDEETSDHLNREDTLGQPARDGETSDQCNEEDTLGQPVQASGQRRTHNSHRDGECLESVPRTVSDDADPVTSLCLDETAEVALLSVTSVLELIERLLVAESETYREALKGPSQTLLHADMITEQACSVVQTFCATSFMQSFGSKSLPMPIVLLRRLSFIVHTLLEIAKLSLELLLKLIRGKTAPKEMKLPLQTSQAILNMIYEGDTSGGVIPAALEGERRSKKTSLQEGVNVSAAELFRYTSGKECDLDENTLVSISRLRKTLKSRKNRLPHVHSVNTPWTQSSADEEQLSGEYFRVSRPQKRQRLRSRNADIDDWLREEKDGDNYADLEDFVVAMDADDL